MKFHNVFFETWEIYANLKNHQLDLIVRILKASLKKIAVKDTKKDKFKVNVLV